MKCSVLSILLAAAVLPSCEAGPQKSRPGDSVRRAEAPGVKVVPRDPPGTTGMPVIPADTARQADMPVVKPPANVQPKLP